MSEQAPACAVGLKQIHDDLREIRTWLLVIALAAGGFNVWKETRGSIPGFEPGQQTHVSAVP